MQEYRTRPWPRTLAMSRARFETRPTHEDNDSEHNSECCDYAGFPCANHGHSPIQGIRIIKYTNLTGTKSCPIFTPQALFCVPGDKKMRVVTINGVTWEGFAPEKEVVIVAPHYAREIRVEMAYWPILSENIYG